MSNRTDGPAPAGLATIAGARARLAARAGATDGDVVPAVAGFLALVPVTATTVLRLVRNMPVELPAAVAAVAGPVGTAALVVPSAAAVAVAVTARNPLERAGLAFVGVFGLLAALDPAASLPAVGAVLGGGTLAVGGRLGGRTTGRDGRQVAVAGAVVAGMALSLGSTSGAVGAGLRPAGSTLALLAVAATPALVRPTTGGWFIGGLAAVGVLAAGIAAPFVTGGAVLVGVAALGVPLPVVAAAVAGGAAAVAGAVRTGRHRVAAGAGLLLLTGVPATVPRAVAVALGLALLVGGGDR